MHQHDNHLVFDLKATDTYAGSGDSVFIEGDPFVLVPNPAICGAANARGVPFRVAGGTGVYAGATGTGRFHVTSNLTQCNGQTPRSQVWFEGDHEALNVVDDKARGNYHPAGRRN